MFAEGVTSSVATKWVWLALLDKWQEFPPVMHKSYQAFISSLRLFHSLLAQQVCAMRLWNSISKQMIMIDAVGTIKVTLKDMGYPIVLEMSESGPFMRPAWFQTLT